MEQEDADFGVWVFHGSGGQFDSGVFTTRDKGEVWIHQYHLSGVLTRYHLDQSVYDWVKEKHLFQLTKLDHTDVAFIQRFISGSQKHYHHDLG